MPKRTTTSRRRTSTTKAPSKQATYFEKALAYLIVSIVVYGCFIYDPTADPLDGQSYGQRLRSERHAHEKNYDIYDYRRTPEVQAYNRNRTTGMPSYYNPETGAITSYDDYHRNHYGG